MHNNINVINDAKCLEDDKQQVLLDSSWISVSPDKANGAYAECPKIVTTGFKAGDPLYSQSDSSYYINAFATPSCSTTHLNEKFYLDLDTEITADNSIKIDDLIIPKSEIIQDIYSCKNQTNSACISSKFYKQFRRANNYLEKIENESTGEIKTKKQKRRIREARKIVAAYEAIKAKELSQILLDSSSISLSADKVNGAHAECPQIVTTEFKADDPLYSKSDSSYYINALTTPSGSTTHLNEKFYQEVDTKITADDSIKIDDLIIKKSEIIQDIYSCKNQTNAARNKKQTKRDNKYRRAKNFLKQIENESTDENIAILQLKRIKKARRIVAAYEANKPKELSHDYDENIKNEKTDRAEYTSLCPSPGHDSKHVRYNTIAFKAKIPDYRNLNKTRPFQENTNQNITEDKTILNRESSEVTIQNFITEQSPPCTSACQNKSFSYNHSPYAECVNIKSEDKTIFKELFIADTGSLQDISAPSSICAKNNAAEHNKNFLETKYDFSKIIPRWSTTNKVYKNISGASRLAYKILESPLKDMPYELLTIDERSSLKWARNIIEKQAMTQLKTDNESNAKNTQDQKFTVQDDISSTSVSNKSNHSNTSKYSKNSCDRDYYIPLHVHRFNTRHYAYQMLGKFENRLIEELTEKERLSLEEAKYIIAERDEQFAKELVRSKFVSSAYRIVKELGNRPTEKLTTEERNCLQSARITVAKHEAKYNKATPVENDQSVKSSNPQSPKVEEEQKQPPLTKYIKIESEEEQQQPLTKRLKIVSERSSNPHSPKVEEEQKQQQPLDKCIKIESEQKPNKKQLKKLAKQKRLSVTHSAEEEQQQPLTKRIKIDSEEPNNQSVTHSAQEKQQPLTKRIKIDSEQSNNQSVTHSAEDQQQQPLTIKIDSEQSNNQQLKHNLIAAVIDKNNTQGISKSKWKLVEIKLLDIFVNILKANPGPPPHGQDAGWHLDRIKLMSFEDQRSVDLYQQAIGCVGEIWPNAKLETIYIGELSEPTNPVAITSVIEEPSDPTSILHIIQISNPELPTADWKVIDVSAVDNGLRRVIVLLNDASISPIKETKGLIYYGFGSITLTIFPSDHISSFLNQDNESFNDAVNDIPATEDRSSFIHTEMEDINNAQNIGHSE